ncbi:hypothetical protein Acr_25g0000010, partial [Actinidia rufa]
MLYNYSKRHWELYNEIEECLEELVMVIYKLRLTPREKIWEDLTLNPLANLHDLISRVKMFAQLKDDLIQAGHLKEYVDHEKTKAEEPKSDLIQGLLE